MLTPSEQDPEPPEPTEPEPPAGRDAAPPEPAQPARDAAAFPVPFEMNPEMLPEMEGAEKI